MALDVRARRPERSVVYLYARVPVPVRIYPAAVLVRYAYAGSACHTRPPGAVRRREILTRYFPERVSNRGAAEGEVSRAVGRPSSSIQLRQSQVKVKSSQLKVSGLGLVPRFSLFAFVPSFGFLVHPHPRPRPRPRPCARPIPVVYNPVLSHSRPVPGRPMPSPTPNFTCSSLCNSFPFQFDSVRFV